MILGLAKLLFRMHARQEARRVGATRKTAHVAGLAWSYYEAGAPDGHPIVVFHGLATDKTMMLSLCNQLGDEHRLILPDVPPFGEHGVDLSVRYDEAYYVGVLWDFIQAIVPADDRPVTLMGSSMGGLLSLLLAIARPEQVDRLVLFAPAGVMAPNPSPFIQTAIDDHSQLTVRDVETFDNFMSVVFRRPPRLPWLIRWLAAAKLSSEMNRSLKVYEDFGATLFSGLHGRLEHVEVPTLLVWGTSDDMLDVSTADVFEQGIADIQVERMDGEGHVMFHENPAHTFALVRRFLAVSGPSGMGRPADDR